MPATIGRTSQRDVTTPASAKTRTSLVVVFVVCLIVGVNVCAVPVSGAAISQDRAKVQFIADEVVEYNAIGNFLDGIQKFSNSTTDAQVLAVSKPLGLSIEAFRRAIRRQSWPMKAAARLKELSAASSTATADLVTSVTNTSSWRSKVNTDIQNWIDQIDIMDNDLGLASIKNAQFVDACQADGATVATAMAAFHAETHGKRPTIALLTSTANGGPYLEGWPHNKPHYTYTLNASGELFLAAPSSAKPIPYRNPTQCFTSFE
jgi:hypothetical protein